MKASTRFSRARPAVASNFPSRQTAGRNYFLVPDPALSMLDELPDFILPVEVPVVVPFFMFVCLVVFMFVCLVVLLVAPGPTFPSLDAPGAG